MAKNNFKISDDGLALIKDFEGERLTVYKDAVGLPTVGVGHLVLPFDNLKVGQTISAERSRTLLRQDVERFEKCVNAAITQPLTQNQFDACVALAFNIGESAFKNSSVARELNRGHFTLAANAFLKWNKAGGKVLNGLTRRREAERKMFLQGTQCSDAIPAEAQIARRGDKSEAVKAIQQRLIELKFLKTGDADGAFGKATEDAVKAFQVAAELTPDGICGLRTKAELFKGAE